MKRIATNLQSVEICSSMPAKIDPGERARPDRFHHLQILEPEVASNDVIVLDGVDVVTVVVIVGRLTLRQTALSSPRHA